MPSEYGPIPQDWTSHPRRPLEVGMEIRVGNAKPMVVVRVSPAGTTVELANGWHAVISTHSEVEYRQATKRPSEVAVTSEEDQDAREAI